MQDANFGWEAATRSHLTDSGPSRDHTRGGIGTAEFIELKIAEIYS